uniref:Uncharacterized protein n=1 Tax=Human herpesvirus 2 TaxID=10310 RepID=A0A481TU78_HHV2|nr:hypothetical protein [Human alphaherpesvirus 2]
MSPVASTARAAAASSLRRRASPQARAYFRVTVARAVCSAYTAAPSTAFSPLVASRRRAAVSPSASCSAATTPGLPRGRARNSASCSTSANAGWAECGCRRAPTTTESHWTVCSARTASTSRTRPANAASRGSTHLTAPGLKRASRAPVAMYVMRPA